MAGCSLAAALPASNAAAAAAPRQAPYIPCSALLPNPGAQELPRSIQRQLALVSVGGVLSELALFADHLELLEEVAPFVLRTVAIEGTWARAGSARALRQALCGLIIGSSLPPPWARVLLPPEP